MRSERSSAWRCARTRRRWPCAASPWPSSANTRARANCCAARRAASAAHEDLARARCVVAEAEVALAMRDFAGSPRALLAAAATLESHADRGNALQARLIAARQLLLLGRLHEAEAALAGIDARGLPPALGAVAELAAAELALRSLRVDDARTGAGPGA
jgi:hypothetical protein